MIIFSCITSTYQMVLQMNEAKTKAHSKTSSLSNFNLTIMANLKRWKIIELKATFNVEGFTV